MKIENARDDSKTILFNNWHFGLNLARIHEIDFWCWILHRSIETFSRLSNCPLSTNFPSSRIISSELRKFYKMSISEIVEESGVWITLDFQLGSNFLDLGSEGIYHRCSSPLTTLTLVGCHWFYKTMFWYRGKKLENWVKTSRNYHKFSKMVKKMFSTIFVMNKWKTEWFKVE